MSLSSLLLCSNFECHQRDSDESPAFRKCTWPERSVWSHPCFGRNTGYRLPPGSRTSLFFGWPPAGFLAPGRPGSHSDFLVRISGDGCVLRSFRIPDHDTAADGSAREPLLRNFYVQAGISDSSSLPGCSYHHPCSKSLFDALCAPELFFVATCVSVSCIADGPFWSLSIEEQFYLFWPQAIRRLTARQIRIALWVVILAEPMIVS